LPVIPLRRADEAVGFAASVFAHGGRPVTTAVQQRMDGAFAAKMATRADIDNLRRIIEQEQRAIAANDNSQDNNKMFHLVLAGATQNQMLLATVESVWHHMDSSPLWQQFNVHIASRAYRLKWLGDRQTILAALRRRDVMGAWQAMFQHLENVKKSLLELSDEDAPDFDGYLFESVPIFQGKLV
jgi:GntR family uxuAB operon transcriptional repressor